MMTLLPSLKAISTGKGRRRRRRPTRRRRKASLAKKNHDRRRLSLILSRRHRFYNCVCPEAAEWIPLPLSFLPTWSQVQNP